MHRTKAALLGASLLAPLHILAAPGLARAQNLNDIGRQLSDQFLGNRANPDQDAQRRAYEQGRRDQENAQRGQRDLRRQSYEERRRDDDRDRTQRDADRRQRDLDRDRADRDRTRADDQRARDQSGRW